jgi:hypothetical protein
VEGRCRSTFGPCLAGLGFQRQFRAFGRGLDGRSRVVGLRRAGLGRCGGSLVGLLPWLLGWTSWMMVLIVVVLRGGVGAVHVLSELHHCGACEV